MRTLVAGLALVLVPLGCGDEGGTGAMLPECGPWPEQSSSPHVLPYPEGATYRVTQGNCSDSFGHRAEAPASRHAYDFGMAMGSILIASREGTVLRVVDENPDGTGTRSDINWIWIRHPDGTVTEYAHLLQGSARVVEGEAVVRGDTIALSGNSGPTTGPHLHFVVFEQEGDPTSIPVTFRNTKAHPNGLVQGESYTAGG